MGQSPKQYKSSNNKQFTIKDTIKYRKYYKTFVIGSGAFLTAFLISSVFAPVQNSDAAQLFNVENTDTGYYVNVSGSASVDISVDANPTGQLAGATDTITTTTNSPRGYQLYISASPNYLYLNGDSSTAAQGKFSPIGGELTSATTLGTNTWGFAFNKDNTGVVSNNFAAATNYTSSVPSASAVYASVPTTDTKIQEINASNYPDGTNLDVYYGIKATSGLPSGTYSGAITYTAISDGVNNNTEFMQDFTTTECASMSTGQRIELMDKRDLKWYYVSKLADGNCWMTSNLALDGTDSTGAVRTLTPEDSNVSENRTLAKNIESGTPSNNTDVQIFSGVAEDATTECNTSYPYCVESDIKYGNLYNWIAATAGAGTANSSDIVYESVCPKGWRLPDNGGNGVDKSFGNLFAQSGVGDGNNSRAGETSGGYVRAAQQAPLYFTLAGNYYDSVPHNQGYHAYYWSRMPVSDTSATTYGLYFNSKDGTFHPQRSYPQSNWFAVRCVFEGSFDTIANMQEMSTSICKATAEGTTAVLPDKRGRGNGGSSSEGYGIVKAKDGNCWMTDNFDLYNKEISAADSDFTSGTYTIPGVSDTGWSGNIYKEPKAHLVTATSTSNISGDAKKPYLGQVYYNWTAAVALTDGSTAAQQNQSICPKNWQLPVNGANDTVDKSWTKLMGATYGYNITKGPQLLDSSNPAYILGVHYYYGSWAKSLDSEWNQAVFGYFWVSTSLSEDAAYIIQYFDTDIRPQGSSLKGEGFSVRCVAR